MTTDLTPTATFEPYAAGVLTEIGIEPYISGGKWRFEVDEVQMMALVTRVHGDGSAAGRTAAADAVEAHAKAIGWYESSGTWAEAIEIARGVDR